jgi:hypothetical protein
MNSVCRQHSDPAFGPHSSPLYYTTVSRLPRRLVFAGLSGDSICSIVLTAPDSEVRMQWSLHAQPINGICAWPLTVLPAHTELFCAWRIEESDWPCNATHKTEAASSGPPPRAGRFRVLDTNCRERLVRGQQRLEKVQDSNLISTAGALFMAELGLYHEALSAVETWLKKQSKRSNMLLARTVQTLIYRQMLRQIEEEQRGKTMEVDLLDWYLVWTRNRERYHRQMTVAMMKGQCPQQCLYEVSAPR